MADDAAVAWLPPIVGLGAGGHAKCVIEAIRSGRSYRVALLLDLDPRRSATSLLGGPVAPERWLASVRRNGVDLAFVGVGGAGDTAPRIEAAARLRAAGFRLPPIVHATAIVSPSARVDEGVQVLAGAIVGVEAVLERDAIVNAGVVVGHDVRVGAGAHVASGARLAGDVVLGAGCHVGTGATVIQGRTIGPGAVVGAGAVVLEDVAPGARVGGVPARPLARRA